MARRCLLLAATGSPAAELLPEGSQPHSVLEQHRLYEASVAGGARLLWRADSALAQRNALASSLANQQVCGDAVLELPSGAAADDVQQKVAALARALEHSGCPGSGSRGSSRDGQPTSQQQSRNQHQQAAEVAAASHSAPHHHQGSAAASQPHEVRMFECEPRQALLWSIAGQATSMRWQAGSVAPGAAGAAGMMSEAAASAAEPAPAAAQSEPEPAAPAPMADHAELPSPAGPALRPETPALPQQPQHRPSLDRSPWAELRPELLAAVLEQAGRSAGTARTLCQVCASWRRGLAGERAALQRLHFAALAPLPGVGASPSAAGGSCVSGRSRQRSSALALPWLVQQAVKAGNVGATVRAARYLERGLPGFEAAGQGSASGSPASGGRRSSSGWEVEAARLWARAARLGHPEGMWKLGFGHYKGLGGLPRDGEEAVLWLTRSAKQLIELLAAPGGPTPLENSSGSSASGSSSRQAGPASGAEEAPPAALLMSAGDCRDILAQAAHILGLCFLDGEGCKADPSAAIRWFRLAERHGCRDAGRMLGSLFNTGMY